MSKNKCYTDPAHQETETIPPKNASSKADEIIDLLITHLAIRAAERDYRELLETLEERQNENE